MMIRLPPLLLLALGGLAGGVFCLLFCWRSSYVLSHGTIDPERIPLAAVTVPPRNLHMTVTDFEWGTGFVARTKKDGRWARVWIPLVTPGADEIGPPGKAHRVAVVVDCNRIKDKRELDLLIQLKEVTGVVTNGWYSLDADIAKKLTTGDPTVDYTQAIILDRDYEFPSPDLPRFQLASGVTLLLAGILCVILQLRGGWQSLRSVWNRPPPGGPNEG